MKVYLVTVITTAYHYIDTVWTNQASASDRVDYLQSEFQRARLPAGWTAILKEAETSDRDIREFTEVVA